MSDGFEPDNDGFEPDATTAASAPTTTPVKLDNTASNPHPVPTTESSNWMPTATDLLNPLGPITGAVTGYATRKLEPYVHPALMKVGEAIAKPFSNNAIEPGAEVGVRSALSSVLGDDILDSMNDKRKLEAQKGFFGTKAGAVTGAGIQMAADPANWVLGAGAESKVAGAATKGIVSGAKALAGRLAKPVLTNAAVGAVHGLTAGEDVPTSAFVGGAMGGVFHAGLEGAGKLGETAAGKAVNRWADRGVTYVKGLLNLGKHREALDVAPMDELKSILHDAKERAVELNQPVTPIELPAERATAHLKATDTAADNVADFAITEAPEAIAKADASKQLETPKPYKQITLDNHRSGLIDVRAVDEQGERVGFATLHQKEDGTMSSMMTGVNPFSQGLDVAPDMYAHAERVTGKKIVPSDLQTDSGKAMWEKNAKDPKFGPDAPPIRQLEKPDADFKPSAGVITQNAKGEDVARVWDWRAKDPDAFIEFPLRSPAKRNFFAEYRRKNSDFHIMPSERHANADPALSREIFGTDRTQDAKLRDAIEGTKRTSNAPNADAEPGAINSVKMTVGDDGHIRAMAAEPEAAYDIRAPETDIKGQQHGYYRANVGDAPFPVWSSGPDPKNPGNILVRKNINGAPMSVPADADKWHPTKTLEQAKFLVPVSIEKPMLPELITKMSPESADAVQEMGEINSVMLKRGSNDFLAGVGDKLGSVFSRDNVRGPINLREHLTRLNAAQNWKGQKNVYVAHLRKTLGAEAGTELDVALNKIGRGDIKWDQLRSEHPKLSANLEQHIQPFMDRIDSGLKELKDDFGIDFRGLEDSGEIRKYGVGMYMRDFFKDSWKGKVPKQAVNDVVESVITRFKASGDAWDPLVVHTEVAAFLKNGADLEAWKKSTLSTTKAFKPVLGDSKVLPSEVRKLLGEIDSGQINIGMKLADVESLLMKHRTLRTLSENPEFFSLGPQPHLTQIVPNNPLTFGHMAGGYTDPYVHRFLMNFDKVQEQSGAFGKALEKLGNWRKRNMLASAGPLVNSTMGGLYSAISSGGLDIVRPMDSGASLYQAAQMMKAMKEDPLGATSEHARLGRQFLEAGADWLHGGHSVMTDRHERAFLDRLSKMYKENNGVSMHTATELRTQMAIDVMTSPFKALGKAGDLSGYLMDAGDRWQRLASAISLHKKYMANPAQYLPGVEPAGLEQASITKVAARIQESFVNLNNTNEYVNQAGKNLAVVMPFLRSYAEEARSGIQSSARIATNFYKDKEAASQALTFASAFAAMYGAQKGIMAMQGWSQNDLDKVNAQRSDRSKAQSLVGFTVKDSDGNYSRFDLTKYSNVLKLFQGNPHDGYLNTLGRNLVSTLLSNGEGDKVERIAESLGMTYGAIFKKNAITADKTGPSKLLQVAAEEGGVPRFIMTAKDALQKTALVGKPYKGEPTMGLATGAARAVNLPVPETLRPGNNASFKDSKKLEAELQKARHMARKVPDNNDKVKEIDAKIQEIKHQRSDVMKAGK